MPADPTPHGATGSDAPAAGYRPDAPGAFHSGDAPRRLAQIALRDLPWEVGVAKPDPAVVLDGVTRTFGGLTAVSVDHLEVQRSGITGLILMTASEHRIEALLWAPCLICVQASRGR